MERSVLAMLLNSIFKPSIKSCSNLVETHKSEIVNFTEEKGIELLSIIKKNKIDPFLFLQSKKVFINMLLFLLI